VTYVEKCVGGRRNGKEKSITKIVCVKSKGTTELAIEFPTQACKFTEGLISFKLAFPNLVLLAARSCAISLMLNMRIK
jgi:hypothetical protein